MEHRENAKMTKNKTENVKNNRFIAIGFNNKLTNPIPQNNSEQTCFSEQTIEFSVSNRNASSK